MKEPIKGPIKDLRKLREKKELREQLEKKEQQEQIIKKEEKEKKEEMQPTERSKTQYNEARNYIKILESEAYIEKSNETNDLTESTTKEDNKSSSSEEIKNIPKKRGRPPKQRTSINEVHEPNELNDINDVNEPKETCGNEDRMDDRMDSRMDSRISKPMIRVKLGKKNKRIRYYMYTGISEDSINPNNNGIIPIINSNWVELVEMLGKEIYLLESLQKHRISIIEVISDRIDFRDFIRFPDIVRANQLVSDKEYTINEYDYLSENYCIPSLTAYIGNRTYDTHESRMLLEFLTTLEDVMVDLGNIVLDVEKKPRLNQSKVLRERERDREEIDITKPDIDPGSLSINQFIQRVDRMLKPLLTTRMIWEEKYAEYYTDDDWFYIDFYKMVEDLSVKEFTDLAQTTYKKRVPDTWLAEQYRDTDDIEEFLAHLEVTIDELYGSNIAQEGSDDFEARLANIINEFAKIKRLI
jgi:hypothetical protein